MRKLLLVALLATPIGVLAADAQTVVLDVQNMTCALCPITVTKALEKVPGVVVAKVDLPKKTAIVQFDPDLTDVSALDKATTNAGFPSTAHN
jgi:mercuric ion binding protein